MGCYLPNAPPCHEAWSRVLIRPHMRGNNPLSSLHSTTEINMHHIYLSDFKNEVMLTELRVSISSLTQSGMIICAIDDSNNPVSILVN